jgi:hypothetical protein
MAYKLGYEGVDIHVISEVGFLPAVVFVLAWSNM